MGQACDIATLWFGLALVATFLASRLKVSGALMEILVGGAAAAILGSLAGPEAMGADQPWLKFLAATGAVLLTFLIPAAAPDAGAGTRARTGAGGCRDSAGVAPVGSNLVGMP
jgi:hypothetical protein